MTSRQKTKRQDERQTPVSEAIAIGTAAGGLVLGTMQAQGVEHSDEQVRIVQGDADGVQATNFPPDMGHSEVTPRSEDPGAMLTQQFDQIVEANSAEAALTATSIEVPTPHATTVDMPLDVEASAAQIQLVAELSQQMTTTLNRVIEGADNGMDSVTLGQSMAADIVHSAQQIVANLDIHALLGETQGLGSDIIAEVLGATSGIANTVVSDLVALPSSLLGNEGSDIPGGVFADLFYSDGDAATLVIPDLSDAAGTLVSDIASPATGLLGLSYVDLPDHQSSHGLNALSLL